MTRLNKHKEIREHLKEVHHHEKQLLNTTDQALKQQIEAQVVEKLMKAFLLEYDLERSGQPLYRGHDWLNKPGPGGVIRGTKWWIRIGSWQPAPECTMEGIAFDAPTNSESWMDQTKHPKSKHQSSSNKRTRCRPEPQTSPAFPDLTTDADGVADRLILSSCYSEQHRTGSSVSTTTRRQAEEGADWPARNTMPHVSRKGVNNPITSPADHAKASSTGGVPSQTSHLFTFSATSTTNMNLPEIPASQKPHSDDSEMSESDAPPEQNEKAASTDSIKPLGASVDAKKATYLEPGGRQIPIDHNYGVEGPGGASPSASATNGTGKSAVPTHGTGASTEPRSATASASANAGHSSSAQDEITYTRMSGSIKICDRKAKELCEKWSKGWNEVLQPFKAISESILRVVRLAKPPNSTLADD